MKKPNGKRLRRSAAFLSVKAIATEIVFVPSAEDGLVNIALAVSLLFNQGDLKLALVASFVAFLAVILWRRSHRS